jgi:hypothetical protein
MKLVRYLSFSMAILIAGCISAQTVKTVNAKVLNNTAYHYQGESAECNSYIQLLDELTQGDKTLENLNNEEIRIMKKYDPYYPDGYNDTEMAWSVLGPGCSWYCGAGYQTVVSSSLAAQGENIYTAESVSDDDVRTAWVEGAKGYGIGEYVEFIFEYNAPRATSVTISNGYNKNITAWKNNSRVKTLNVYEDDKLLMVVNLADTRDLQRFDLPHPIPNRKGEDGLSDREEDNPPVRLRMMISEVYKGDKYDDTAISEITFDGLDVHCLPEGTIITMADRKKVAIEKIKQGDKVLVWDPVKKRMDRQEVVKIHTARHPAEDMISIHYRLNKEQTLSLTADHPVYSLTGWLSANPSATRNYKRYADARVGKLDSDAILYRASENGKRLIKKKIDAVESFENTTGSTMIDTYTLELEGNGIFFANGFAVGQE